MELEISVNTQISVFINRTTIDVDVCWYKLPYNPSLCPVRGPERSDTPNAVSTPRTHILASKFHPPLKGTRVLWRNGWSQGSGTDFTGHNEHLAVVGSMEGLQDIRDMSEEHRAGLEEPPRWKTAAHTVVVDYSHETKSETTRRCIFKYVFKNMYS